MKKKTLKIALPIVVALIALILVEFFFLTGLGTGFARTCSKIQVGMTKDAALSVMSRYENKNGVEFTSKSQELSYGSMKEHYSGYYECTVYLDEQGNVESVFSKFD